jgi:hypothetical protein
MEQQGGSSREKKEKTEHFRLWKTIIVQPIIFKTLIGSLNSDKNKS